MGAVAQDRRLPGLVRDRRGAELERMYRRHATDVYRYALMVLRSAPDAEDVTQATFVRAHRALASGERVRKPRHWLLKIAHRECLRHLQSAAPVPAVETLLFRARHAPVQPPEVPAVTVATPPLPAPPTVPSVTVTVPVVPSRPAVMVPLPPP